MDDSTVRETLARSEQLPEEHETGRIALKVSDWYEDSRVSIAVNAIPHVGGAIHEALSYRARQADKKRVEDMFTFLRQEVHRLGASSIDWAYLQSEEFHDLILKATDAATRTRDTEKLHLYAKILAGAVVSQDRADADPETHFDILSELTSRDLELLGAIYKQQKDLPPYDFKDWVVEHMQEWIHDGRQPYTQLKDFDYFGVEQSDRAHLFLRLLRTGLVLEAFNTPGFFVATEMLKKIGRSLEDLRQEFKENSVAQ